MPNDGIRKPEAQHTRLRELGDYLRRTREGKRLSIEDAVEATKVRGRYLQAIEDADYERLPADVYTRGFVRSYADYLGLNGAELTNLYLGNVLDVVTPSAEESAREPRTARVQQKRLPNPVIQRKTVVSSAPKEKSPMTVSGILMGFLAAIVIVGGGIWALIGMHHASSAVSKSPAPKVTPHVGSKQPHSKTGQGTAAHHGNVPGISTSSAAPVFTLVGQTNTQSTYRIATTKPVTYTVQVQSTSCWMQVTAGGQNVFSGTLYAGQSKQFTIQGPVFFWLGKNQVVSIALNHHVVPSNSAVGVYHYAFQS